MSRKKHHKQTQDTSSYEEGIYKGIRKISTKIKQTSSLDEEPILSKNEKVMKCIH